MTLAYTGDSLTAASAPAAPITESLDAGQVQPLFTEALSRWRTAGVDTSRLGNIDIRIAALPGLTLGEAVGQTIWLDDNAAGWGWFADPTPWDDSGFTTPGDRGEQDRMDLLSVMMHEMGHVLGFEHANDSIMAEALAAGMRRLPAASSPTDDPGLVVWGLPKGGAEC